MCGNFKGVMNWAELHAIGDRGSLMNIYDMLYTKSSGLFSNSQGRRVGDSSESRHDIGHGGQINQCE